jgi:hypothetical protein
MNKKKFKKERITKRKDKKLNKKRKKRKKLGRMVAPVHNFDQTARSISEAALGMGGGKRTSYSTVFHSL